MCGYRDPDERDPNVQWQDSRAVFNVLMAPVLLGGILLYEGIVGRNELLAAGGALVWVGVAAMVYIGRRRGY